MAKIIIGHYPDENNWGQMERVDIEIITDKGNKTCSIGGGEPEDMSIARDLSDIWSVPTMLKLAYEAGKNGEELEFIDEDLEE